MFRTKTINDFYQINYPKLVYQNLHGMQFQEARNNLIQIQDVASKLISQDELVLNDIFLLKQVISFHSSLIATWEEIYATRYSSSWNYLQNCLNLLRSINKFSLNNKKNEVLDFFERQLLILEKLYPYSIFFSVGWEVALYECSICGKNIDSFECEHDIGELYSGVVAIGIAKEVTNINHISMVDNPMDKRCVAKYEDNSCQFKVLQYLNQQLVSNKITPITLYDADESPRKKPNETYVELARNDKCFCGSNKKFKQCCIGKKNIEENHIELIIKHDMKLW
jgi:hypothetical protein